MSSAKIVFYENKNNHHHQFLNKKRQPDYSNMDGKTFNKLIDKIKNKDNNDELIPRKIEFKLSHILHGENTTIEVEEKNENYFNDDYIDSLLTWKKAERVGPGLNNLGNTCFLNSVLQSLFYTSPLRNYVIESDHMQTCKVKGVCFICEYGKLVKIFCNIILTKLLEHRQLLLRILYRI
jgi:ubiquitin C-terminal hydrolase